MNLTELAKLFSKRGAVLYGVGGMVRNPLLGLPVSDTDLCSRLRPEEVIELAEENGIPFSGRWRELGMVELTAGSTICQHTTFRSDTYPRGGVHRPASVAFADSPEVDAFRRDFTVNALYVDILSEKVIDPTGGLADMRKRLIRATSPDPMTIMKNDALRILRMVRFASELGFEAEEGTFAAAGKKAEGLRDISPQRIREELEKILLSDARYGFSGAVLKGLNMLDRLGAIDIIIPELTEGRDLLQKAQYHKYKVMEHMFHAADCAAPVLELRLGALLHDVGKPRSLKTTGRMYVHDIIGVEMAEAMLSRLGFPPELCRRVTELVRHHMFDLKGEAREDTIRLWLQERGPELGRQLIELRRADVHGSGIISGPVKTADRWEQILSQMEEEKVPFTQRELNISGADLVEAMGLQPGPWVGRVKQKLLLHCAKYPGDNTREKLLITARDMGQQS